jgi:hypothetical protein
MRDRPAGFGFVDDGEVKPLSSIKNAEIVDVEVEVEEEAGTGMASASSNKVRARLSVFFFVVLPPFFPSHTYVWRSCHRPNAERKRRRGIKKQLM